MAKTETVVEYAERETLDAELMSAVSDIMSAEQKAKAIIANAAESVKAVQLDGSNRERDMREGSKKLMAAARDEAFADATSRAEKEVNRKIEDAQKRGEELIRSKKKDIDKAINELYISLGGKK